MDDLWEAEITKDVLARLTMSEEYEAPHTFLDVWRQTTKLCVLIRADGEDGWSLRQLPCCPLRQDQRMARYQNRDDAIVEQLRYQARCLAEDRQRATERLDTFLALLRDEGTA